MEITDAEAVASITCIILGCKHPANTGPCSKVAREWARKLAQSMVDRGVPLPAEVLAEWGRELGIRVIASDLPIVEAEAPEGDMETFFVLAEGDEEQGGMRPGAALHRSSICGYLISAAVRHARTIAEVRGNPAELLEGGGHCICSHCGMD